MFPFYTPWKDEKPKITSIISGGIKWEHHEKAWNKVFHNTNQGIHYDQIVQNTKPWKEYPQEKV